MNYLILEVTFIKIKEATIFGFGKWIDYKIDFSNESFLYIYGENESGKSTLQQFVLFILFGLPPKQRNFFRPKTSGKMGGRLIITDTEIGDYIIERLDEVNNGAAICYTSDGTEYDEDWLNQRLKGMTADVYKSIFTFSALDLKDFHLMKNDDLGEVILGIGLTGSSNIYALEKRLDKKLGDLFKPTGKVPSINKQLDELDERFIELTHFKNNEATYREKQEELSRLNSTINSSREKLRIEKENQVTLERTLNNFDTISDYHAFRQQSTKYSDEIIFPEKGLERLNILKEKTLPHQSQLSFIKNNLDNNESEQLDLSQKLLDSDVYKKAENILEKKEHYRLTRQEYYKEVKTTKDLALKINENLSNLNVSITTKDLPEISFPFYIEKVWNELKSKVETQEVARDQLEQEKSTLEKQLVLLNEQSNNTKNELLREDKVSELQKKIDMSKEQDYIEKRNEHTDEKKSDWKKLRERKTKNINVVLVSSIFLGILSGLFGLLLDASILYPVMFIVLVGGLVQFILGKRSIKETNEILINESNTNVTTSPVTNEEKLAAEKQLQNHDENKNLFSSIKEQKKSLDIEFIKWTEKYNGLNQQDKLLMQQIEEQESIYPFLFEIELNYWPEFFQKIKQVIDLDKTRRINQQDQEKLREELNRFETIVELFLESMINISSNNDIDTQLVVIEENVQEHKDIKAKLEQIKENHIKLLEEINQLEEHIQIYNNEVNKLYHMAKVENEEDYYKQAKQISEKQLVEENMTKNLDRIQLIFSEGDSMNLTKNKPDQSHLEVKLADIISKIEEIDQNIDADKYRAAELNVEISQMESSESYSNTMHAYTMDKERLEKLGDEWSVLKVAKEMLTETKRQYRNKYLTKIIKKTSEHFKQVTGNRYVRVIAPIKDNSFQVETSAQMRYYVNELSKGTIDQLYICLRLAISEIMSEEHHVPFIIDDAFVHFDGTRTQKMLDILIEISKNQQVIYFSCKKETLQLLPNSYVTYLP